MTPIYNLTYYDWRISVRSRYIICHPMYLYFHWNFIKMLDVTYLQTYNISILNFITKDELS